MARDIQLPCNGDGGCMRCMAKPPSEEILKCSTCVASWHVTCLSPAPETLASPMLWQCPDCSGDADPVPAAGLSGADGGLVAGIRAIEADESLTEMEKAKKRQELMGGKVAVDDGVEGDDDEGSKMEGDDAEMEIDLIAALGENLNCSFCIQLPDRPVTTPCGHNFCLKCFQKWIQKGKRTCAKCRARIPQKMASNPRINAALVSAIRLAKTPRTSAVGSARVYHYIRNEDRPDTAFTTERAKKAGNANAAGGKIFVTVAPDHLGPIPAENDPVRNQGVLVGESWKNRHDLRQWGVHFPQVAGIAGQSKYGAQSVVLSGGYEDDEDHGEWFLYTGSGGRDLSGNKRTNKEHSFDQKFCWVNEALRLSCKMGYPVRVVRSHKEERTAYAPEAGIRYDGVYRIEKCWRKAARRGFKVCRYLFVRCDNEPAPWTSDEHGDRPRPLPKIRELKKAINLFERTDSPSWDFDEADGRWKWVKPPPASRMVFDATGREERKRAKKANSVKDRLLKEFSCQICRQTMNLPVTTPCAHNFCKECLEAKFSGMTLMRERNKGGRTLRTQKNIMNCPCCSTDISDFLQNPQVNRDVMEVIEALKTKIKATENAEGKEESGGSGSDNGEALTETESEPPSKRIRLDTETA
ncbi:PREDICTED: E3 ubiquitin-protein ligase ORTHRUS 2-like [Tarenaya hassleriana]|uniref:E3 ubiquitin-protein ligase ORTHRUS 2-like n=1 Tax=Tarenaya hassleriana TaxID=28532 RepID=UPI00053C44B2|nr:PREDICTED: E3 ubiquitin-protein ligase ORTHRUS 2-like [Tarenaya hassleriana]